MAAKVGAQEFCGGLLTNPRLLESDFERFGRLAIVRDPRDRGEEKG